MVAPEEMNELERLKFRLLLHSLMLSQSNIFAQTKFSDLPISEWQAQTVVIKRVLGSPGGSWFWNEYAEEFDTDFRSEIDDLMK